MTDARVPCTARDSRGSARASGCGTPAWHWIDDS